MESYADISGEVKGTAKRRAQINLEIRSLGGAAIRIGLDKGLDYQMSFFRSSVFALVLNSIP
jgi:hypothetical protein